MIDCHYHLDRSMVSLDGLIASMDAAGIERIALIPAMCPPLQLPVFANLAMPAFRRMVHGKSGMLHSLGVKIYQDSVKPGGKVDLLGKKYPVDPAPDNEGVAAAVAERPDRFFGWVFVNPAGPEDPVNTVEKYLSRPGMIGVKAHPFWHDFEISRLLDVAALCAERGVPMLIHLGTEGKGDFRLLPEKFPRLKMIYAHAGIPYGVEIWDYVRERDNVYVDLSATGYVDKGIAARAVKAAGPDKCLFGSDGPYFAAADDRYNYGPILSVYKGSGLMEADARLVGSENFLRIIAE